MLDYNDIIIELKELAYETNMSFIISLQTESGHKREVIFATKLIAALHKKKHLLAHLSKIHRKDLNDCLITHGNKYVRVSENLGNFETEIKQFTNNINEIIEASWEKETNHINETKQEQRLISERLYKITKNLQLLFAEQSHNKHATDFIQTQSIALCFDQLKYDQQNELSEKLMQIKELWEIVEGSTSSSKNIQFKFQSNPVSEIELPIDKDLNISLVFDKIVEYFTLTQPVFEELTDEQIVHLYDRLKNLDKPSELIISLLNNLHQESQFRYSYNRISESGYDLLDRFQSYDSLIHQINNLEFSLLESYLTNNSNFINDFLEYFREHIDNIVGLSLNKDEKLKKLFKKLEHKIHHLSGSIHESKKSEFNSIRGKLGNTLKPNIQKKYTDLDKFVTSSLQKKYHKFFDNMGLLIEEKDHRSYIENTLNKKFAKDFYLPNLSNSIEKLRKMAQYRIKVIDLLSEFSLIDIFLNQTTTNKIKLVDYKNLALRPDIHSAEDFVHKLLLETVEKCNAFQLEILYKQLKNTNNHTELQIYLKRIITKEIHHRTSISKMMISIVQGKKKEYNHLKAIKKAIKNTNNMDIR